MCQRCEHQNDRHKGREVQTIGIMAVTFLNDRSTDELTDELADELTDELTDELSDEMTMC